MRALKRKASAKALACYWRERRLWVPTLLLVWRASGRGNNCPMCASATSEKSERRVGRSSHAVQSHEAQDSFMRLHDTVTEPLRLVFADSNLYPLFPRSKSDVLIAAYVSANWVRELSNGHWTWRPTGSDTSIPAGRAKQGNDAVAAKWRNDKSPLTNYQGEYGTSIISRRSGTTTTATTTATGSRDCFRQLSSPARSSRRLPADLPSYPSRRWLCPCWSRCWW